MHQLLYATQPASGLSAIVMYEDNCISSHTPSFISCHCSHLRSSAQQRRTREASAPTPGHNGQSDQRGIFPPACSAPALNHSERPDVEERHKCLMAFPDPCKTLTVLADLGHILLQYPVPLRSGVSQLFWGRSVLSAEV